MSATHPWPIDFEFETISSDSQASWNKMQLVPKDDFNFKVVNKAA